MLSKLLASFCLFALTVRPAWAGGVEDYLYDMGQMQKTDPNGFNLMIVGISLIFFLSLTILVASSGTSTKATFPSNSG
jgi:hypothetical protein